ncbi:CDK-activating kinase assembly factor [Lindgomyces ingoldianus]|uniref:CDK-activating kinase assembly factor n=1 Tax=Lindgomyces ingoldianus TaxID=673940 RepID=A0ACB6QZL8_9PLEO|nr:CDK-activating kinase assembly factor [Lindgomyces ingoldianus]KAF2472346.1 CDK-activating kinase assembly factor [Lindgomyces ingoldianus]
MSRVSSRASGTSTKRLAEDGDICPVCKSSRYLNPNMRFLVNPECYHRMCESCVDRIFSHGPAPCPIAGCKRTLRKARFRSQTFEDLKVEREVDIRRRVARVMNKTESDFETLADYNNYLETVETVTWNLILKIDLEATERRLRLWEEAQKAELESLYSSASRRVLSTADQDLQSDTQRVILKKSGVQRKTVSHSSSAADTPEPTAAGNADTGFRFHGLKKRVAPEPEKPFDPYGGWSLEPQYYVVQPDYDVDFITGAKTDIHHLAGGYDLRDFYSRALCEAFSGFGVFVQDEIIARENGVVERVRTETQAAASVTVGVRDVNMDDVF